MKLMKTAVFGSLVLAALTLSADGFPLIRDESVELIRDAARHRFTIRYALENSRAVVIADVMTNGVPVAAEAVEAFSGRSAADVAPANRIVEPGEHKIVWQGYPQELDGAFDAETVSVRLTAYSLATPPDYMCVDLVNPSNVLFYAGAERIPHGAGDALYKTDRMLFRKIPSCGATWRMGSPGTEAGRYSANEDLHTVTFTNRDFYIGVYEVTQRQYERIKGENPSGFAASGDSPRRPVETVNYNLIRGTGTAVDDALFIGLLRKHCGLGVDLPLDAQWEFACRAGTTTPFNDGSASCEKVGWYSDSQTHEVGSKAANAFGLYDMHGNVWEMVRDGYKASLGTDPVFEPVNPGFGGLIRGGSFSNAENSTRSARRNDYGRGASALNSLGFRMALDSPLK